MRPHPVGTLQLNATNIAQAAAEHVIQFGCYGCFTGTIRVGGGRRLPMLIRTTCRRFSTSWKTLASSWQS